MMRSLCGKIVITAIALTPFFAHANTEGFFLGEDEEGKPCTVTIEKESENFRVSMKGVNINESVIAHEHENAGTGQFQLYSSEQGWGYIVPFFIKYVSVHLDEEKIPTSLSYSDNLSTLPRHFKSVTLQCNNLKRVGE